MDLEKLAREDYRVSITVGLRRWNIGHHAVILEC